MAADAICDVAEKWVPMAWGAFADEAYLKRLKEKSGLSAREFREFLASLKGD